MDDEHEKTDGDMPLWVQWVLALIALGLGAWFVWVSF